MADEINGRRNGIRLPASISWGHLINLGVIVGGLIVHYMMMHGEIRAISQRIDDIERMRIQRVEEDIRDLRAEYRGLREKMAEDQ